MEYLCLTESKHYTLFGILPGKDWIIDLGPEGGKNGGELLFQGLPEDLIQCERSLTGKYLASLL